MSNDDDDGSARATSKTGRVRRPDGVSAKSIGTQAASTKSASTKSASTKAAAAKPDGAKVASGTPEKRARTGDGTSERRAKPVSDRVKPADKPSADAAPQRSGGATRSSKRPAAEPDEGASARKSAGATSSRTKAEKPPTGEKAGSANGGERDRSTRRPPGKSDRVAREMEQLDLDEPPALPRAATVRTAARATSERSNKASTRKNRASSLENESDLEARPPTGNPDKGASLFTNEVDREDDSDLDDDTDDSQDHHEDDAVSEEKPKARKSGGAKPKPGGPKGEGGPPPPKKPHPLFLLGLLGVPAVGVAVMVYVKWDMFANWFNPKPPEVVERVIEKSESLEQWDELHKRTDALSLSLHPVIQKISEIEDKLARSEKVDFDPVLAEIDALAKSADECKAVCTALLEAIRAEANPPLATLDEAIARARKMNHKGTGLNIGTVIDDVDQRIQDIAQQRRKLLEIQREVEGTGTGSGSKKGDDSVVPGMGS